MKKAELVEWALEAQRTAGRAALFAEEEQEELENLKKDLFQDRGELESLKKEIEAVKENKQLKEEIECLEVALAIVKDKHAVDKKNVHKLMDELKQLKEEVRETWVCDEESAINYVYENGDAYDDWVKGSTPYEELKDEKKEIEEQLAAFLKKDVELKEEMDQLKEREKGIMDYEHAGILGCDSYERFCQAMCELEYDEKWISEMKRDIKELKKENQNFKDICTEYLDGTEHTANPACLSAAVEGWTDEIVQLKEEKEGYDNCLCTCAAVIEALKKEIETLQAKNSTCAGVIESLKKEIETVQAKNIVMFDAISDHVHEEGDIADFEFEMDKDGCPIHPFTEIRIELNAEIKKLNEEKKEIEEQLAAFWMLS